LEVCSGRTTAGIEARSLFERDEKLDGSSFEIADASIVDQSMALAEAQRKARRKMSLSISRSRANFIFGRKNLNANAHIFSTIPNHLHSVPLQVRIFKKEQTLC
jgi:glycine cleavage system pyridoxal-binding protein P